MTGSLSRFLGFGVGLTLGAPATAAQAASLQQDTAPSPAHFERDVTSDRPAGAGSELFACIETELGWVVSNDPQRTKDVLAAWRAAAAKFRKIFGRAVPRGAVIVNVNVAARDGCKGLQQTEVHWWREEKLSPGNIGWPGETDSMALVAARPQWEDSIRQALRQRWPKLTAARLQDTVTQLWGARVQHLLHDYSGHMSHEIAHMWFDQAYTWNKAWNPAWKRPPLPDWMGRDQWLNEAVGVVMEGPYWQHYRHTRLVALYRKNPSYVVPLDTLFASPHPMNGPHGPQSGNYDNTYISAFYAQLSGVLEFLIAQTKDSTVLGAIAASQEKGATMAEWLQANGSGYHLPRTVKALDQQWWQWFERQILAKY